MLTARAENFLYGRTDLDETIRRLQAFEAAGADVLYAPGIRDLATIKTVVSALKKPFNLVMGFADPTLTVKQLSAAGVKRISVGGAMSRVALAAFLKCAREMKDQGSFTYVRDMAPIKEIGDAFAAVQT
jgi:2-methylisocitrate lyase-like PEP mutase family enzyme